MHSYRKHLPVAFFLLIGANAQTLRAEPSCPGGGASGTITVTDKKLVPAQASVVSVLKAEQR